MPRVPDSPDPEFYRDRDPADENDAHLLRAPMVVEAKHQRDGIIPIGPRKP